MAVQRSLDGLPGKVNRIATCWFVSYRCGRTRIEPEQC